MSKVLIDLSILKDVIDDLIYARDTATDRDDYKRFSDQVEQLESVIEESNSKRFSVLEWHDVKEAPSSNAERVFVEYSGGGFGFVFGHPEIIKDDPDYKRWAYLPDTVGIKQHEQDF